MHTIAPVEPGPTGRNHVVVRRNSQTLDAAATAPDGVAGTQPGESTCRPWAGTPGAARRLTRFRAGTRHGEGLDLEQVAPRVGEHEVDLPRTAPSAVIRSGPIVRGAWW